MSTDSRAWVVNAYLLTYGGFLLLGGRCGDLFGRRRLFAAGIAVFTLALSLIVSLFPEPAGRAKAMGVYGFIAAGGGSLGVLLGGVLTSVASWHWIFLVNVPIGAAVLAASFRVLPADPAGPRRGRLDVTGAVLVTAAVVLAVYAIIGAGQSGWLSARTAGALTASVVLVVAFAVAESRAAATLVPLRLLRQRNLPTASVVGVLLTPLLLAATSSARPEEAGLASGLANTAFMLGGALGLAVLASIAAATTQNLAAAGHTQLTALTVGYHAAFLAGAVAAVLAAVLAATLLRPRPPAQTAPRPSPLPARRRLPAPRPDPPVPTVHHGRAISPACAGHPAQRREVRAEL